MSVAPLVLGGPAFAEQCALCNAKLSEATAALAALSDEVLVLRASGAPAQEAVAALLEATDELNEAFEFVDVLAHNVRSATALIDATERRLDALEAGQPLPPAIAQLPPVQFVAHQFSQQLQRRERAQTPELPELSQLPPAASERRAAGVLLNPTIAADELELQLEQLATAAAERAASLASSVKEKTQRYTGPGSFFQRLTQQVVQAATGNAPAAAAEAPSGASTANEPQPPQTPGEV